MQWVTGTTTNGSDMALVEFDKFDDITGEFFGGNLDPGPVLLSIEGLKPGYYATTVTWYWDGLGFGTNVRHAAEIENGLGVGIVEPNMCEMPRTLGGHGGGDPAYSFTIGQYYPRLYDDLNLATPVRPLPDFSFWVGQNSGSAKDCYVSAEVAYWSATPPVVTP
jgi:hypothetical protein